MDPTKRADIEDKDLAVCEHHTAEREAVAAGSDGLGRGAGGCQKGSREPARNRQELIEARRQKAEQRKAHKKELREKAKIAVESICVALSPELVQTLL
jgi:hypothetical protein